MELKGKVAFITGAAAGVGKGVAEKLLQNGGKVFLTDIDEVRGEDTLIEFESKFGSQNVRFMKLDVSNSEQFNEVFYAALSAYGNLDIVFNNAGITDEVDWQRMVRINVNGVAMGTKLAEQHMRRDKGGKGGKVINMSSVAGLLDSMYLQPMYSATKHAVRCLTMSYANQCDCFVKGIEYAAMCPSPVETGLKKHARLLSAQMEGDKSLPEPMPLERAVDAFFELIQLKNMNGAILKLTKDEKSYQRLNFSYLGTDYFAN